jgi:hypothetical protein
MGFDPTEERLFLAAHDHFHAHVYRDECPGVDAAKFYSWRLGEIAALTKSCVDTVSGNVGQSVNLLEHLANGQGVADLGWLPISIELLEACAIKGVACVSRKHNKDGTLVSLHMADPATARQWLDEKRLVRGAFGFNLNEKTGTARFSKWARRDQ